MFNYGLLPTHSLNKRKTIFMIHSKSVYGENVSITLNGNNISRVTSHNFLGVTTDETHGIDLYVNKVFIKVLYPISVTT